MKRDETDGTAASSRMPFLSDILIFVVLIILLVGAVFLFKTAISHFQTASSSTQVQPVGGATQRAARTVLPIVARSLGGFILLYWLLSLWPGQRRYVQASGSIMKLTVFQLNILPFLLGLGLAVTGQIWLLLVAFGALLVAPFLTNFCVFHLPWICGGLCGDYAATHLARPTWPTHVIGFVTGVILIVVLMKGITGVLFVPLKSSRR